MYFYEELLLVGPLLRNAQNYAISHTNYLLATSIRLSNEHFYKCFKEIVQYTELLENN